MLQQKYKSVLDLGLKLNVQNGDVKEEAGVLKVKGTTKTPYEKDLLWDEIKRVGGLNPNGQLDSTTVKQMINCYV